ncbi:hypothetical protein [Flavobacterium sp.]|uniref:hypothetical protein n=1 Tax=Flavobacterium sp. TaxID=239 RepID=UPI0025E68694|nr:hypothetical protein [Flavobacterium sp.]
MNNFFEMKQLFLSLTLFVIATSFAQQLSGKVPGVTISKPYSANDTVIKVIYNKPRILPNKKPAFYINGTLVNQNILRTLNQIEIETVNIEKEEFKIDTIKYYGKIFITTKNPYKPKIISLSNLKAKYLESLKGPVIFQIDNEQVIGDYDQYPIDEKYILKIIVEDFENSKEKLNLHIVKIILKTEENIKKANNRIRGGKDIAID